MRVNFFLLFILFVFFASCQKNEQTKITIALASNLKYALEPILQKYAIEEGVVIDVITGSSGKLTAQISAGAPYDIFIAADSSYTNFLHRKALLNNKPTAYIKGTLSYYTPHTITHSAFDSLLRNCKRIAIANPVHAPFGKAAMTVLNKQHLSPDVQLIYAENALQVLHYVESKTVPLGVLPSSILLIKKNHLAGAVKPIDINDHNPIIQSIAIINTAKKDKIIMDKLITHITSSPVRAYLYASGYHPIAIE